MAHDLRLMHVPNEQHWVWKAGAYAINYFRYPPIKGWLYNIQSSLHLLSISLGKLNPNISVLSKSGIFGKQ